MDKVSEDRLSAVHPALADRVRLVASELGQELRVSQALRTFAEQDALFAKGRTAMSDVGCRHHGDLIARQPGTCSDHPRGATVTNARGGESWHNYGLAVDVVPIDHARADFNADHPVWKRIVELAPRHGLVDGISFHDLPHLQLTGPWGVSPTKEVRNLYRSAGDDRLGPIWDAVDDYIYALSQTSAKESA